MKKSSIAAAVVLLPLLASAQSSMTISGSAALGLRHVSNASVDGSGKTELAGTQDGLGNLAFSAREDLGGGLRAVVILDSAVALNTGVAGTAAGHFNRQSTVALQGNWGSVTAGRQVAMSGAAGPLALADPLTGNSAYLETTWLGMYSGLRYNNAIQYAGAFDKLFVGGLLTMGERTGSSRFGRTAALSAGYQVPGTILRAAIQQSTDGTGKDASIFSAGGFMTVTPSITLHGAYLRGKYDAGFVSSPTNGLAYTSLGLGIPLADDMRTNAYIAGVTWRLGGPWSVKAAYHVANNKGATFLGPLGAGDGKQEAGYLFVNYALSKRTSLQGGVDHNRWSGKWGKFFGSSLEQGRPKPLDGSNTRTTYSIGVKHVF